MAMLHLRSPNTKMDTKRKGRRKRKSPSTIVEILPVENQFDGIAFKTLYTFSRSALEVGAQRPSPGSIGKLKLSSEMRQRLEKVTANHSVRSTKTTEKPALPREDGKVKRLEDNRKLLLEQQLGNSSY